MALTNTQLPEALRTICEAQLAIFNQARQITVRNSIPDTTVIPLDNQTHWFKVPDVTCVFVDMTRSTQLSAARHDRETAGAYQLFTGTAVRLFAEMESPYIDVRGDGVFALFDSDKVHRALAAAVTFKTFAHEIFVPEIEKLANVKLGAHIGIDRRTLLVRRIGLRRVADRTDRQNEVWAGKPVNMASKLASLGEPGELVVSDRFHAQLKDQRALLSCGCPNGAKTALWETRSVAGVAHFDFETAYVLKSKWCATHGAEFCAALLNA
jgi:class 3 adenylate cyclase